MKLRTYRLLSGIIFLDAAYYRAYPDFNIR